MNSKFCFHMDLTEKSPKPKKGRIHSNIQFFFNFMLSDPRLLADTKKNVIFVSENTVTNKAHLFVELQTVLCRTDCSAPKLSTL